MPGSKFGIALDELPEAVRRLRAAGARLASIGAHIGSDISDLQPFGELARMLGGLADELGADGVDLGGGWAGPPATYAAAVRPHLSATRAVVVEAGRGLVADGGWLLTSVVWVQDRGHLVADAGMTELLRPMLYGARHPVAVLTPEQGFFRIGAGRWRGRSARRETCWPMTSTSGLPQARAPCSRSQASAPTDWRWPRTTTAVCDPPRP